MLSLWLMTEDRILLLLLRLLSLLNRLLNWWLRVRRQIMLRVRGEHVLVNWLRIWKCRLRKWLRNCLARGEHYWVREQCRMRWVRER